MLLYSRAVSTELVAFFEAGRVTTTRLFATVSRHTRHHDALSELSRRAHCPATNQQPATLSQTSNKQEGLAVTSIAPRWSLHSSRRWSLPSRPLNYTRSIWKMLCPFATTSRLTPIHQMSLAVLSRAACASMSTTTPTTTTTMTTTTTRDRGDRYGPMEWAQ